MTNYKQDGVYNCPAIGSAYKTGLAKLLTSGEIHSYLLQAACTIKNIALVMQSSLVSLYLKT